MYAAPRRAPHASLEIDLHADAQCSQFVVFLPRRRQSSCWLLPFRPGRTVESSREGRALRVRELSVTDAINLLELLLTAPKSENGVVVGREWKVYLEQSYAVREQHRVALCPFSLEARLIVVARKLSRAEQWIGHCVCLVYIGQNRQDASKERRKCVKSLGQEPLESSSSALP